MTSKEHQIQLVQLAIQQVTALLLPLPAADADFIIAELFHAVPAKYREHQTRLYSLVILEIADREFLVRANGHAEGTLIVRQKGGKP